MHVVRIGDPAFLPSWKCLLSKGDHLDALYGAANLAYYREYSGCTDSEDLSFMVVADEQAICGVRAFRHRLESGAIEIACFSLPVLYIENPQADTNLLARAQRLSRTEIESLLQALPVGAVIRYKDTLPGGCLSPLGRMLLEQGAIAAPCLSQFIDLSMPSEALHKGLTKAYKWAVNWAKKNLVISVLDQASITTEHLAQFRRLHVEAAGRETRTPQSWALQYDMVRSGEAFCVFAWMEDELVSAALFPHSKSHCFYGVSASRRSLFDKPLSHGVIWTALLHAKMDGLKCFEMGEQLFPMLPRPDPSRKELGISFFKRAFGGKTRVFLDLSLKLNHSLEAEKSA
jgi:hypothetical protein